MNFFTAGFFLCGINFNMGFPAVYVIRLAGLLFMLTGIRECDAADRSMGFSRFTGMIYVSLAACAAALACSLLGRFGVFPEAPSKHLCTAAGCISFFTVIFHQNALTKHIRPLHSLVNDPSLLDSLRKKWQAFAVFAAVSTAAEALNRTASSGGMLHTVSGVILVASRIIMFGTLISMTAAFDRVRRDFNTMHPV